MQADAKHQENDADLSELAREIGVTDKPGRERTEGHAGEEIAHKRRQAQPMRHEAAEECQHQPHGDRGYERDVVRHVPPCSWRRGAFIPPAGVFCLRCGARNARAGSMSSPLHLMECGPFSDELRYSAHQAVRLADRGLALSMPWRSSSMRAWSCQARRAARRYPSFT